MINKESIQPDWKLHQTDLGMHVLPDKEKHSISTNCKCNPLYKSFPQGILIRHNSYKMEKLLDKVMGQYEL